MTQFCALFLGIYALLAPQRGAWHNGSPLNTPLLLASSRTIVHAHNNN